LQWQKNDVDQQVHHGGSYAEMPKDVEPLQKIGEDAAVQKEDRKSDKGDREEVNEMLCNRDLRRR
jgi:hypothetical protein